MANLLEEPQRSNIIENIEMRGRKRVGKIITCYFNQDELIELRDCVNHVIDQRDVDDNLQENLHLLHTKLEDIIKMHQDE